MSTLTATHEMMKSVVQTCYARQLVHSAGSTAPTRIGKAVRSFRPKQQTMDSRSKPVEATFSAITSRWIPAAQTGHCSLSIQKQAGLRTGLREIPLLLQRIGSHLTRRNSPY
ncbi:hypothetical protein SNOG_04785 [Parastagonospora nodorum SN15]|uniref:Uncharacterized protein n=1 Tax=Phaeosphaeria nodorum (strain SN15 / ATCC MYA-4574 / FGSC 10173) TaxID=321614 RepID=Q0UTX9_PHANO|nr:hypothetical protein SNOG_04785 [Parastagonospora nodorum SN15]EAT87176.1 hypothetical protein SNOG_04785 [Parastagonospora nodorum SN15]